MTDLRAITENAGAISSDLAAKPVREGVPHLFLFSDHRDARSHALDRRVIAATGKDTPSVVWLPSGANPEKTDKYFQQRRTYYRDFGITDVAKFGLHEERTQSTQVLLECDILHLSGGDLYLFLAHLRRAGVLEVIRQRAARGGIVVGDSGGAMLLAPTIEIARFGKIPRPAALTDLSSVGLVDFEFHPHFGSYGATEHQLLAYSKEVRSTVYAAPDGCGLEVAGDEVSLFGDVTVFEAGRILGPQS